MPTLPALAHAHAPRAPVAPAGALWRAARRARRRAGRILQAVHPFLAIAMQPQPHDVLPAVVHLRDPRHTIAPSREQHHLRPQRHPPDRLAADLRQLPPLVIRDLHAHHTSSLPRHVAARFVPNLWSCA